MTKEEYISEIAKQNEIIKAANMRIQEITDEYTSAAPIKVGDIVLDSKGCEVRVAKLGATLNNEIGVALINKKNIDGTWGLTKALLGYVTDKNGNRYDWAYC